MINEQIVEYYNKLKCSNDNVIESLFANAEIVSMDELQLLQIAYDKWERDKKPKSAIVGKGFWVSTKPPIPLYYKTGIDFTISPDYCKYWTRLNEEFDSYFNIKKSIRQSFDNLINNIHNEIPFIEYDYIVVVGSAITTCAMMEVCKDIKTDCYIPTPNINEFAHPDTPNVFSCLYNSRRQSNNLGYL